MLASFDSHSVHTFRNGRDLFPSHPISFFSFKFHTAVFSVTWLWGLLPYALGKSIMLHASRFILLLKSLKLAKASTKDLGKWLCVRVDSVGLHGSAYDLAEGSSELHCSDTEAASTPSGALYFWPLPSFLPTSPDTSLPGVLSTYILNAYSRYSGVLSWWCLIGSKVFLGHQCYDWSHPLPVLLARESAQLMRPELQHEYELLVLGDFQEVL